MALNLSFCVMVSTYPAGAIESVAEEVEEHLGGVFDVPEGWGREGRDGDMMLIWPHHNRQILGRKWRRRKMREEDGGGGGRREVEWEEVWWGEEAVVSKLCGQSKNKWFPGRWPVGENRTSGPAPRL